MKKVTIITVCLNVKDSIEATMKSVLEQTYENIEYIIQDGGSADGTVEIIRKYQEKYPITFILEKDSGLYNAMNRATMRATGDYILFMNSNDVFHDPYVVEKMVPYLEEDIVMGNVVRIRENGEFLEKYPGKNAVFKLLLSGRMPCHQVLFTKREVMQRLQFQERFSITADFDFLVRACKQKCSMKYVDVTVAKVENITGISAQESNLWKMREQDDQSLKENYWGWYQLLRPVKWIKRTFIK